MRYGEDVNSARLVARDRCAGHTPQRLPDESDPRRARGRLERPPAVLDERAQADLFPARGHGAAVEARTRLASL